MTRYFLGVDIGATKSHALIADDQGRAVSFGAQGPGNYEVVGWDGMQRTLQAVTEQALSSAGIAVGQLAGAGFGIAGYDWPGERAPHEEAIATLNALARLTFFTGCGYLVERGMGVTVVSITN